MATNIQTLKIQVPTLRPTPPKAARIGELAADLRSPEAPHNADRNANGERCDRQSHGNRQPDGKQNDEDTSVGHVTICSPKNRRPSLHPRTAPGPSHLR